MLPKSIIFLMISFLGHFYRHLAIFSGHTGDKLLRVCLGHHYIIGRGYGAVVDDGALQYWHHKHPCILESSSD